MIHVQFRSIHTYMHIRRSHHSAIHRPNDRFCNNYAQIWGFHCGTRAQRPQTPTLVSVKILNCHSKTPMPVARAPARRKEERDSCAVRTTQLCGENKMEIREMWSAWLMCSFGPYIHRSRHSATIDQMTASVTIVRKLEDPILARARKSQRPQHWSLWYQSQRYQHWSLWYQRERERERSLCSSGPYIHT